MQQRGHLQSGEQSIATHAMAGRQNMARLLATEASAHLLHRLVDVLITNGGALEHPSLGLPGTLKAEV